MNKRGQFYLIAALVIIIIISGLVYIYIKAETPAEDIVVYDLTEEINFEASQVIANGIFEGKDKEEIKGELEKLSQHYSDQNPDVDITFAYVYGDEQKAYIIGDKKELDSGIQREIQETPNTEKCLQKYGESRCIVSKELPQGAEQTIEVHVGKDNYPFIIKKGRHNFFMIVKRDKDDQRTIIVKNSPDKEDQD